MIKYVEYDSFDEYGQHIIPVNDLYHMNKMASGSYSPELMKVILNMKRQSDKYYVVINALGSYEIWGCNRNADAFPEVGLMHKSLRTDMGTPNDYGYKTFEYYAKLYKHHVNKDPKNSFGDIIFSHWNPMIRRVELIVAINTDNAQDIIDALEKNEQVAVSMGCKVKYDRCRICDNKSSTREKYCKHLKNYLKEIIDKDLAAQWSKETGKKILPGTQVFTYNDYPRFFDISRVYIGADRTAYILGKAASKGHIFYSADIADAKGVTDTMIDKLATVKKEGDIDKEVGGALGPQDVDTVATPKDNDGSMYSVGESDVVRKALDEKMKNTIIDEPQLPNDLLDSMASSLPLETIFSTMLGLGIHPKPVEFQRIVLVKINQKPLAEQLENNNTIFNYQDDSDVIPINFSNSDFSDTLGRALTPFLQERSCFPSMLGPRIRAVMIKTAQQNATIPWPEPEKKEMKIDPKLVALSGLAALFAGLKMKAMGYGPRELADFFANKPWLRTLVGGSIVWKLYDEINKNTNPEIPLISASEYNRVLPNTHFSGHFVKQANDIHAVKNALGWGIGTGALLLPAAYTANVWNQQSTYQTGRPALPLSGITQHPKATAIGGGLLTAGGIHYAPKIISNMRGQITKMLKK